jgi:NAD(P) transhydrogenase subunit alpha
MKIAAVKESLKGELRAALSPETVKLLVKKGYVVLLEWGVGIGAGFSDQSYVEAGAGLSADPYEILSKADVVLKVRPSAAENPNSESYALKQGSVVIGMLSPSSNREYLERMAARNVYAIAMELVPRISKMQMMDVLSSQSNVAGYAAVLEATRHFNRILPMMTTAAGSIPPAKVLVLGIGVAGLQAIATAKRLGASVSAYDVRSGTKEQAESLGAKFLAPAVRLSDMEDKSGYAKENSEQDKLKQEQFLQSVIKNYDIVITTAQIPGKSAPLLISQNTLDLMLPGSVIVDMAVASGGNVFGSQEGEVVDHKGVKIIDGSNLPNRVPYDASKLYSKNLYNFLEYAIKDGKVNIGDPIVSSMIASNKALQI